MRAAVASSSSADRAAQATVAPALPSASAIPRPIPRLAPVTSTMRPVSECQRFDAGTSAGRVVMGLSPSSSVSVRQALRFHPLAGHDVLYYLRRPVADLEADDVAQALLEWQLVRVAVVAVEQQALVDRLHREPRRPPLHHRRLLRVRLAVVREPEGAVAEPPRRLDVCRRLGDGEGDPLELRQRAPERLALLHVRHRLLQRAPGGAEAGEGDDEA